MDHRRLAQELASQEDHDLCWKTFTAPTDLSRMAPLDRFLLRTLEDADEPAKLPPMPEAKQNVSAAQEEHRRLAQEIATQEHLPHDLCWKTSAGPTDLSRLAPLDRFLLRTLEDADEPAKLPPMPEAKQNLSAAQVPEIIFTPDSKDPPPQFYAQLEKLTVLNNYHQHPAAKEILQKSRPRKILFDNNVMTTSMLEFMGKNKRLQELSMQNCTFGFYHSSDGRLYERVDDQLSDLEFPSTLIKLIMNHTHVHERYLTDETKIKEFYFRILEKNINLKYLGIPVPIFLHTSHIVARLKFLEVLVFCYCEWHDNVKPAFHRIVRELPQLKAVHIHKHEDIAGDTDNNFFSGSELNRFMERCSVEHRIDMTFEVNNTDCKILLVKE